MVKGMTGFHSVTAEEKSAFVEFININLTEDPDLAGVVPINSEDDSIYDHVTDGIVLCKMINLAEDNAVDNRALNYPKKKALNMYQKQENLNLCINSAKAIGCSVVNIGAKDIIEKNPVLIFALMWQIIRIKAMRKINLIDHPELYRLLEEGETLEQFLKLPPEQILLRWFNFHLAEAKHPRRVTNFDKDLMDGENYIVLLAKIAPEHCDRHGLQEEDPVKRAEIIITDAEKLGVKRFLKPNDIAKGKSRLNLLFVAELFNHWPALAPLEEMDDKLKILLEEDDNEANKEEKAYRAWVNNIGIEDQVQSLFTDLTDGHVLLQVLDKMQPGCVDWKKVNKRPVKMRVKKNENVTVAFELAKKLYPQVKIVGISAADLTEESDDPKHIANLQRAVLAVIWQLRRQHLMNYLKEVAQKMGKEEFNDQTLLAEANERVRQAGKTSMIKSYSDPSIKTGRFLWDLIGCIEPRAIDESLYRSGSPEEEGGEAKDNEMNAKYAIAAARKIGCSIFAIWEDIAVKVNPKMILTMVGSIIAEGHKVTDE